MCFAIATVYVKHFIANSHKKCNLLVCSKMLLAVYMYILFIKGCISSNSSHFFKLNSIYFSNLSYVLRLCIIPFHLTIVQYLNFNFLIRIENSHPIRLISSFGTCSKTVRTIIYNLSNFHLRWLLKSTCPCPYLQSITSEQFFVIF